MTNEKLRYKSIDEYIADFPKEVQEKLEKIRQTIITNAPDAFEVISYNMPAFKLNSILLYFAAFKNHIGFYPYSTAIKAFEKEVSVYKYAKGSIQFPLNQPIPYELITKIVKYRVKENLEKAEMKKKKK